MPLNGKLGELSDGEFRALVALWAYCSRKRNDGVFRSDELRVAMYATPRGPRHVKESQLERFIELGLVQQSNGALAVNDWGTYQPSRDTTAAERMRRYRERQKA